MFVCVGERIYGKPSKVEYFVGEGEGGFVKGNAIMKDFFWVLLCQTKKLRIIFSDIVEEIKNFKHVFALMFAFHTHTFYVHRTEHIT